MLKKIEDLYFNLQFSEQSPYDKSQLRTQYIKLKNIQKKIREKNILYKNILKMFSIYFCLKEHKISLRKNRIIFAYEPKGFITRVVMPVP